MIIDSRPRSAHEISDVGVAEMFLQSGPGDKVGAASLRSQISDDWLSISAPCSEMDEIQRHRLFIARELRTWTADLPRLIRRIDGALELPDISDSQAFEAESIVERIGLLLRSIQAAVNSGESNARLSASADRLREEVAAADATIDALLKSR
jgi:hypothetical protein